ncbi:unnamed protein product [Sphenostylis stenocarpa]|uniref:DM2 domain-containing protein n=1 Tax=Sphenostylis stenocarpa TaxID=92480 RepID=A0AA86VLP3_9FABA|nr:unnamed protein product [Sphenostylis stenocarpa]
MQRRWSDIEDIKEDYREFSKGKKNVNEAQTHESQTQQRTRRGREKEVSEGEPNLKFLLQGKPPGRLSSLTQHDAVLCRKNPEENAERRETIKIVGLSDVGFGLERSDFDRIPLGAMSVVLELVHDRLFGFKAKMLPQRMKKAITDNPKKLANLIDLVNLPSTLREFVGQSQISRLGCFMCVWSYIKTKNLQDPNNKNVINCDDKLKSILLGKPQVELAELPALIKMHFPKEPK